MQKRWLEHAEGMVAGRIGSKLGGSYAQWQAGVKVQHNQGTQPASGGRQRQKLSSSNKKAWGCWTVLQPAKGRCGGIAQRAQIAAQKKTKAEAQNGIQMK